MKSIQRFQGKSWKYLSQSEARAAILFCSDRPEKHKLGTGHWDLNCFLSSFVEFCSAVSEEESKMSQPIRGQGCHLVFTISSKNTNLVEDIEILLPVMFRWILFSGFRGEVENVSANQRPGRPSCFSDRPQKHKLGRGHWDLASCQVSLNSVQQFQRRSRKCLSQSQARAAILFFPIGLKNTNLVEDVEILLPVTFRWILFSGFRGEVENVSANQSPGWPSYFFPIGPKNSNLVEDIEILLPVMFRWILFSGFRGEVENVSVNHRPGRPSCFSDRPEKHKLGRGHWNLDSCQVSLNSVQRFQRKSRKCEKLTTDGLADRRTTRDHNSAL